MTHVPDIIRLEKEAEELETEASRCRWEAAGLMVEELDAGTSQRRLAEEIGKSQSHVRLCAKVWREYLGTRPVDRPAWNTAYQAAKRPPKHDDGPDDPSPARVRLDNIESGIERQMDDLCSMARTNPEMLARLQTSSARLTDRLHDVYEYLVGDDRPSPIQIDDKTGHGSRMLDTVPNDAAAPVLRIASALRDIANGDNPERAFLHACQAVTDLAAH